MLRATLVVLSLGILGGFFVGCTEESGGRLPVSGTVTFQGSPLKSGTISFEEKSGTHKTGGAIVDGKYDIPASRGLTPGTYTVRVTSVESSQAVDPTVPPGPEAVEIEQANKETIPAEFNMQSTLSFESGPGKTRFDVTIP